MAPLIRAYLAAFVFTQAVEVPIYRFVARVTVRRAFVASLVTHPIVWFVFFSPRFTMAYDTRLVLAELFAVVVEACVMAPVTGRRKALAVALLANAASLVIGMISRAAFGVP